MRWTFIKTNLSATQNRYAFSHTAAAGFIALAQILAKEMKKSCSL